MRHPLRIVAAVVVVVSTMALVVSRVAPLRADQAQTYVVLYKQQSIPADAASVIERAGGSPVYAYDPIGVLIARSTNSGFAAGVLGDNRVEGVASTARFAHQADHGPGDGTPAADAADLWEAVVPEIERVAAERDASVVGVIAAGIDPADPGLQASVDAARSVSCAGGVPNHSRPAWDDYGGTGTQAAEVMLDAIVRGASATPVSRVTIAGLRVTDDNGNIYPDTVICAYMWAGTQRLTAVASVDLTSEWARDCRDDAEQRTIWLAEQRAIHFASRQGVAVVTSDVNGVSNLGPSDSPDTIAAFGASNACIVVPIEIDGTDRASPQVSPEVATPGTSESREFLPGIGG